jgi:molybdate transport system regulatory protein
MPAPILKLKAQLLCGTEIAIGPGKAAVLEAIEKQGSISAAGRTLGMSYRRTWQLVDVMNRCWEDRLVQTLHGGGRERGARLTPLGEKVLAAYLALNATLLRSASADLDYLASVLRSEPLDTDSADNA